MAMILDFILIVAFALAVGVVSSMVGISGGAYKTPVLIIVFGLGAEIAAASSLFSALFVSLVGTVTFSRQEPMPIQYRIGLFLAVASVPGALVGVALRTMIGNDFILRLVFGIMLFPVALSMFLARRTEVEDHATQLRVFDVSELSNTRWVMSFFGALSGGIAAGLLGIGGGSIIVPVLCTILKAPMLAAAATSIFTMVFTTSAGTIMNYVLLPQYGDITTFLYFGIVMGVGKLIGGQMGPRYASRIDACQLKRAFGLFLVFPLVKMMSLGQIWLDPLGQNFVLEIIGDIIIWMLIVVPIGIFRMYREKRRTNTRQTGTL